MTLSQLFLGGQQMKISILSVGTEILMGQIVNTNSHYLSQVLAQMGLGTYYHYTVGDNHERLKEHIRLLLDKSDLVITTGGLGPTMDDLTKEAVAEVLGLKMILDEKSKADLESKFARMNREMPKSNLKQAYFPEGATILSNEKGTAPGCLLETADHKRILILPGPPKEMKHVFEKHMKPILEAESQKHMASQFISIYGLGESMVESELMDLFSAQTDPTLATYASDGHVILRITSSLSSKSENEQRVLAMSQIIQNRIGQYIVSYDGETIVKALTRELKEHAYTLSVAESCTGGQIASEIIKQEGVSSFFDTGLVTYSNHSKENLLKVSAQTLDQHGAVSPQVCEEMLSGLKKLTKSSINIVTTGIAGPDGGTEEKPVGLVYIGVDFMGRKIIDKSLFSGDREQIQKRTVYRALKLVWDMIQNN